MSDHHSVVATLDPDCDTASVDESPSPTANPGAKTKDEAAATIKSVHSDDSSNQQDSEARPWVTTLVRLGPLTGICGLLLAFASIIAALGILLGSRGQSAGGWQPSTYLAICTAIANQAMRYSAVQGVVIAWWYRAFQGRSTLAKLHRDWRAGTTIRGALTSGRHIGLLGLACISSTFVVVDGPLLQRASTVGAATFESAITLNVTMAQEIPRDWSGAWAREAPGGEPELWIGGFNATIPTTNGNASNHIEADLNIKSEAIIDWYKEASMIDVVRGCPSLCNAKIRAPALSVSSCESMVIPTNYSQSVNVDSILGFNTFGPLNSVAFLTNNVLQVDTGTEKIVVATGYFMSEGSDPCVGTLNITTCVLESAIGEYDVQISDNITTLLPGRPTILAIANNTQVNNTYDPTLAANPSTLGAIVNWMSWTYGITIWYVHFEDTVNQLLMGSQAYANQFQILKIGEVCYSSDDPWLDFMGKLDRLMFSSGAFAAKEPYSVEPMMDPGLPINTTTVGVYHETHNIFHSNLWWWFAAAMVELLCIAVVLPTYVGWWKLGRPVTFSPLEIAKAFEAPILSDCNSNASARDLASAVGSGLQVKYGVKDGQKLAFAPTDSVTMPKSHARYGV